MMTYKGRSTVFSRSLLRRMRERGMTQRELADRVGMQQSHVSEYVHGISEPKVSRLLKIADVLCCRPSELLEEASDA